MGMAPRHVPGLSHPVLPPHLQPMVGPCFSSAGVPLEQVSRHVVVSTDASTMSWGAMCNGHAAAGLWTGPQLQWHINCLELLAVWLALRHFKMLLHEKHVLVRTDNTATIAYINHRGVASSWALARGASIADICKAAGWATPNTFSRFYNLRIEPVSSRVLVSDGQ